MNRFLMMTSAALVRAASTMASAQSQSPATRRAHEVLALINSATPGALRAYVDTDFATGMRTLPMQAHLNFFLGQREQSGRLDWVDVQEEEPNRITALVMNTDAYELDRVNPNLAVGYQKKYRDDCKKQYRNNSFMHVIRGGPAGGGYSTAEDLVRFAEALKSGKLVSLKTFEELTTPKPELNSPEYGYGFGVDTETRVVGHSGGFSGISFNLDIFKGTGYVAVVLSNYGGASQPVVEKIRTLVRSRTAPATP